MNQVLNRSPFSNLLPADKISNSSEVQALSHARSENVYVSKTHIAMQNVTKYTQNLVIKVETIFKQRDNSQNVDKQKDTLLLESLNTIKSYLDILEEDMEEQNHIFYKEAHIGIDNLETLIYRLEHRELQIDIDYPEIALCLYMIVNNLCELSKSLEYLQKNNFKVDVLDSHILVSFFTSFIRLNQLVLDFSS